MSRQRAHTVSIALIVLALGVAGCMPGPNPLKGTPVGDGHVAGFGLGFWHGLIGPVTFVMSLLKDGTGFYEVHNNGGWYNAGFLLGLGLVLGSSFKGQVQMRRGSGRLSDDLARPDKAKDPTGTAGAEPSETTEEPPEAPRRSGPGSTN